MWSPSSTTTPASFLALQGGEIRQLYTRPDRIGRGAGTELIEAVKSSGVAALELWCFQANARARRFLRSPRLPSHPLYRRRRQRRAGARRPLSVGSAIGRSEQRERLLAWAASRGRLSRACQFKANRFTSSRAPSMLSKRDCPLSGRQQILTLRALGYHLADFSLLEMPQSRRQPR